MLPVIAAQAPIGASPASIRRFSPIASERAPTIASVIQSRSWALGTALTARKAPTYANGSAKTVCSNLTSRAKRAGYANTVIGPPDGQRVDRSFHTDARAKPVRPENGVASAASCLAVRRWLAGQELQRVSQSRPKHLEAISAAAR